MAIIQTCDESHPVLVPAVYRITVCDKEGTYAGSSASKDYCREHFADRMSFYTTGGIGTDQAVILERIDA